MATYYVNTLGSNTAPYDTKAKGAPNLWTVRQQAATDLDANLIVYFVANSVNDPIQDGNSPQPWGVNATINESHITSVQLLSDPNNEFKPILDRTARSHLDGQFQVPSITDITVKGIKFKAGAFGINCQAQVNNLTIEDNEFINGVGVSGHIMGVLGVTGELNINRNLGVVNAGYRVIIHNSSVNASTGSISNNTFIGSTANNLIAFLGTATQPNISVTNNILVSDSSIATGTAASITLQVAMTFTFDFNIFWFPNSAENKYMGTGSLTEGADVVIQDPLFADEVNYTLSTSSPAIDAGVGGVNIGWDQLTQKVVVRGGASSTTANISYFYPVFGGGGQGHGYGRGGKKDK